MLPAEQKNEHGQQHFWIHRAFKILRFWLAAQRDGSRASFMHEDGEFRLCLCEASRCPHDVTTRPDP